uniref:NAD(P)/FAD-dependent oxidoreductase n=1 Tax=Parerythrobacter lutipelagi TaxID=1964208 RepID=UPI0010F6429B|nr:FAD-dependent oxidoreductase [Parerythrobacter lutipelagi]
MTEQSGTTSPATIAIIGAGIAGVTCATELARHGVDVRLFDKGRGPGGRMATRRAQVGGETLRFDHGAQYFTARDPDFIAAVSEWERAGVVARWPAAGDDAWVGTPAMNAPVKAMAEKLDVTWGARIERIERAESGWHLTIDGETQHFAEIIVAVPAEQVAELLGASHPAWAGLAAEAHSDPCWAVMASFADRLPLPDAVRPDSGPIGWAARNGAKPGRGGHETWVIHASPARSRDILEHDPADAARTLLADFAEQTGIEPGEPLHLVAHRWRYAMADPAGGEASRFDEDLGIGVCGDWLASPRVEGAFVSGLHLARRLLQAR